MRNICTARTESYVDKIQHNPNSIFFITITLAVCNWTCPMPSFTLLIEKPGYHMGRMTTMSALLAEDIGVIDGIYSSLLGAITKERT